MPLIQDDDRSDGAREHDDSAQNDSDAGAFAHALPLTLRPLGGGVLQRLPATCTRTRPLDTRGVDGLRGLSVDVAECRRVQGVDRRLTAIGDVLRPRRTVPVAELVPAVWIGVPVSGRQAACALAIHSDLPLSRLPFTALNATRKRAVTAVVRPADHSLPCAAMHVSGVSYDDRLHPCDENCKCLGTVPWAKMTKSNEARSAAGVALGPRPPSTSHGRRRRHPSL